MASRSRLVLGALAAVVGAGLSGCAAGEPVPFIASTNGVDARIAAMPGVAASEGDADPSTGRVDLTVTLLDDVTPEELDAIGAEAAAFAAEHASSGAAELVLGDSAYSFFSAGGAEDVAGQLRYWLELARLGFERVAIRDLVVSGAPGWTDPAPSPDAAEGAIDGSPAASPEAAARYVLLDLADDDTAAAADALFAAARTVADPGAASTEWEVTGFGDQTSAEFIQAGLPDAAQISRLGAFGELVAELDEHATIRLAENQAASPPLAVEMTLFDERLGEATVATAEDELLHSPLWRPFQGILGDIDKLGADYDVELLANPLRDAGNFELELSVRGCVFTGDADWPALSEELGRRWLQHRSVVDAGSVASGACQVAPAA